MTLVAYISQWRLLSIHQDFHAHTTAPKRSHNKCKQSTKEAPCGKDNGFEMSYLNIVSLHFKNQREFVKGMPERTSFLKAGFGFFLSLSFTNCLSLSSYFLAHFRMEKVSSKTKNKGRKNKNKVSVGIPSFPKLWKSLNGFVITLTTYSLIQRHTHTQKKIFHQLKPVLVISGFSSRGRRLGTVAPRALEARCGRQCHRHSLTGLFRERGDPPSSTVTFWWWHVPLWGGARLVFDWGGVCRPCLWIAVWKV